MFQTATDTILNVGVAIGILLCLAYFIDRRFWPWYTLQYWPARQRHEETQTKILSELRDGVNGIRTLEQASVGERNQIGATLERVDKGIERINFRMDRMDGELSMRRGSSFVSRPEPTDLGDTQLDPPHRRGGTPLHYDPNNAPPTKLMTEPYEPPIPLKP